VAALPLEDLRVVELAHGVAGPYCGKLFADLGAEVVKVEPPGGDPARRLPPLASGAPAGEASGLFAWLNANKRDVVLDLGTPGGVASARALCRDADVVVETLAPGGLAALGLGLAVLAAASPGLVLTSITWFGQHGPYRDFAGTDGVVQALAGLVAKFGPAEGPPVLPSGHQAQVVAGLTAFIGAMGALVGRRRSGGVRHLDVSVLEANLCFAEIGSAAVAQTGEARRRRGLNRFWPTYPAGIYPCRDGWIGVTTLTPVQWQALCELLGLPEAATDPRFAATAARLEQADAIDHLLAPRLAERRVGELVEAGQRHRIPLAPVPTMAELLACPHWRARHAFARVTHPDLGEFEAPGVPFRLGRTPARATGRAPRLGEDGAPGSAAGRAALGAPGPGTGETPGGAGLPLAGVRVLDLSMGWSGPLATRHLGDLGAEVIKVEAAVRPDWWRGWDTAVADPAESLHEKQAGFNAMNRNKLGITLDLGAPDGARLLRELARTADLVVENNAAGVMDRLGLGYAALSADNPALVMVSMPAFGGTGPWAAYRGYGSTVEQASGLPHLNGLAHWPPVQQHVAYGDPVAGLSAAAAALAALYHRQRTGEGQAVDVAQVECLFPLAAEGIVAQSLLGAPPPRLGSRRPDAAPRGCFRCRGDDAWLAVTVEDDAQWRALAAAIGRPDLADDPGLRDLAGRQRREDEIERAIGAWADPRDADEAMRALQAAGVPAAAVRSEASLLDDPHLLAREVWQEADRAYVGRHRMASTPYRLARAPLPVRRPAPTLGQHTARVLATLGLGEAALADLAARGITGVSPIPR
jgi:crotonobetainyl-CoA:carnitine CoA-transferase CaiB-like acyl-CoA transferase